MWLHWLRASMCVTVTFISALLSVAKAIEPGRQYAWWIMLPISHWTVAKANAHLKWHHVTQALARTVWSGILDPGVRWLICTLCEKIWRLPTDICWYVCDKCSAECGNGTQTRGVACIFSNNGSMEVVDQLKCSSLSRPITVQPCILRPCGVQWYVTEWSAVSVTALLYPDND